MMGQGVDARRVSTERLAHNLRARRRERGLSTEGLAEASGLTATWIAAVEKGVAVIGPVALARLAAALDTSVARLEGVEAVPGTEADARESQNEAASPRGRGDKGLAEMAETECYARLALHRVGRIPVVDTEPAVFPVNYVLDDRDEEDRLQGIVSRADLLKVFLRSDDEIEEEVRRTVVAYLFPAFSRAIHVNVRDGIVTLRGHVSDTSLISVAIRPARAVEGVVDVEPRLTREHGGADESAPADRQCLRG